MHTKVCGRMAFVIVALSFALLFPRGAMAAEDNLLVGAIRWDAWFNGSPWAKEMSRAEWSYRLPFFANVTSDEHADINGLNRTVMAKETLYAGAAGIDYFIFGLYSDRESDGSTNNIMANFRRSIDLFKSLADKHTMHFSVYFSIDKYAESGRIRELLSEYVADQSFLRTRDGRPVVFLFLPTAKTWVHDIGGQAVAKARLQELQKNVLKAAGKRVYVVVMAFNPDDGARLVSTIGFDAFTSYGDPLGPRRPADATGEEPYTRCMGASRYFWAIARRSGEPFFPPVSLGWDYRPVIDEPTRGKDPEWCNPATTKEIKSIIQEAANVVPVQQPVRSIVLYAWNEYSEGSWLAPTLCNGADRLMAVAEARGRSSKLEAALHDDPPPRRETNCRRPPEQLKSP